MSSGIDQLIITNPYNEPEKHFWHSAYSGCDRFTMTVKFSDKNMLDMAVNDLTSSEQ